MRPQYYKYLLVMVVLAIIIKSFRRPIALLFIIGGLPSIYHIIKHDSETDLVGIAMILGGATMWWMS